MTRRYRGIHELYSTDPERAHALLWGEVAGAVTRRGFLNGSAGALLSAVVRAPIPYARYFPVGLMPAALAQTEADFDIPVAMQGKDRRLIVLNDRPINAETPAHLLDDDVTPAARLFVRNNGIPPTLDGAAARDWRLEIAGESCGRPQSFSVADLKRDFEHHTLRLQLECAGNGRAEFSPPATGNQWSVGAVGCPEWTGVRVRDVLSACGIKEDALYIGYYGADVHLSGDPNLAPISRGVPMSKALEDESLIAWAMNGEDIPALHGHPLRLVCGGWPASVSGKWLRRIVIRNRVHDGEKMEGHSYRVPCEPVAPGADVPVENMCIIESMPVKSLITFPKSGITHDLSEPLPVRGQAWAGDLDVREVHVSVNFGATWQQARLDTAPNRLAWQRWSAQLRFSDRGYYELWARAVDGAGRSQPVVLPAWNPRGYLNNAAHRIAVQIV